MNRRPRRDVTTHTSEQVQGAGHSKVKDHKKESSEELVGKDTTSSKSQGESGVFKRLRQRFTSVSKQFSTNTSTVSVFDSSSIRVNDTIIIQTKQAPCYQCVPLPPGCIPSETILIVDNQHQPFVSVTSLTDCDMGKSPAEIDGTKMEEENQNQRETFKKSTVVTRNGKHNILYNNWVNPNF